MKYLLDTNAWVAYIRGKDAHLLGRLRSHMPHELGISTIVLSELYYGAYHSGAAYVTSNLNLIQQLLLSFRCWHTMQARQMNMESYDTT